MKSAVIVLVALVLLFVAMPSIAKESAVDKQVNNLKTALQLTDEQAAKIKDILTERAAAVKENKKITDEQQQKEANKKVRQEAEEKIQAVLTDEQKAKYAEYKKEQRQKSKEKQQ